LKAGVSVHTLEDALQAEQKGADYVMFGHIFTTRSKPGLSPRGLDALRAVAHTVKRPVVAIGGIHPHNAKDVVEAGAAGIAVMSALFSAENPQKAARSFHFVHKGEAMEPDPFNRWRYDRDISPAARFFDGPSKWKERRLFKPSKSV